jgi:O-antigen ligase
MGISYENDMILVLVVLAALCALGVTLRFPNAACVLWVLVLETSPDIWLAQMIGGHETIIAVIKGFGLVLVAVLGLRHGIKRDRYNPGFAFAFMFVAGTMHGLYPGLTLLSSARSLLGSAAPFLFSFVRLPEDFAQATLRTVLWGPLFAVAFGALLTLGGVGHMYALEQGALRLGASGEPPFLAGFALIGVYAGLMAVVAAGRGGAEVAVGVNIVIILLTGARVPLVLALLLTLSILIMQWRILALAALGAGVALGAMFLNVLSFLRVVDLVQLGEATDLSNRNLVWPYFEKAFGASPFFGWGVGAGKVVIPNTSALEALIGTNAAHDEYLRIGAEGGVVGVVLLVGLIFLWVKRGTANLPAPQAWMMRLIFLSFAVHSATDNTLIATTSSVFFLWVSAIFASAPERTRPAP